MADMACWRAGAMLPYIGLIGGMTLCTFEEESVIIR